MKYRQPNCIAIMLALATVSFAGQPRCQMPAGSHCVGNTAGIEVYDRIWAGLTVAQNTYGALRTDRSNILYGSFSRSPNSALALDRFAYMGSAQMQPTRIVATSTYSMFEITRDAFFVCGRLGELAVISPTILPMVPMPIGDLRQMTGIPGFVVRTCSNGRDLFACFGITQAPYTVKVIAIDMRSAQPRIRYVATLPPSGASVFRDAQIAMGRDGEVISVDWRGVFRIDNDGNVTGPVRPLPPHPSFVPNQAGSTYRIAYDEWSDELLVGSLFAGTGAPVYSGSVYGNTPWLYVYNSGFFSIESLCIADVKPFEVFGVGCANATGSDPRLGWQGLPLQGMSFGITLRDCEPNGLAVLWLGASDAHWAPLGQLPADLSVLGAPGCRLLVSPDVAQAQLVDAGGNATVHVGVPVNPALAGLDVFAQSASTSTGNNFGYAASDALVIRLR